MTIFFFNLTFKHFSLNVTLSKENDQDIKFNNHKSHCFIIIDLYLKFKAFLSNYIQEMTETIFFSNLTLKLKLKLKVQHFPMVQLYNIYLYTN